MTVLSIARSVGRPWSEIREQVKTPKIVPFTRSNHPDSQEYFYVVAETCKQTEFEHYYMSNDGLWFAGKKPPKYHNCVFVDREISIDAYRKSISL